MEDGAELRTVTAVVVVWNSGGLVVEQLRTLEPAFAEGMRMVLLDNASADDSFARMSHFLAGWRFAGQVELLRSADNVGFCAGVNRCVETALAGSPAPEFIWMLNPDAVVNHQTIQELVAVNALSGCEIVCPQPWMPAKPAAAGWPRSFWLPYRPPERASSTPRWWETSGYQGACVLFEAQLARSLVKRDGYLLDPRLFMYCDERDTVERARSLGARVAASRDAVLEHDGGGASDGTRLAAARQYYLSRNSILVGLRHLPRRDLVWMLPLHLLRDASWLVRATLSGGHPHVRGHFEGVLDAFRGRTGRWSRHPDANR